MFFVLSCVCYVLCTSVYMCFVVTCWERADLLALVCGVFCEFVTFPLVSWVRCGTWLYRFLIFAPLLTFDIMSRGRSIVHIKGWHVTVSKLRFTSALEDCSVLSFIIQCRPSLNTWFCGIISESSLFIKVHRLTHRVGGKRKLS